MLTHPPPQLSQPSPQPPLPDDPAQLKLLIQLREAEGRAKDLEVRVHALELAAAEAKLRTAESWLRERDAHVAVLEREKTRLEERARANERMPLVEYVAFRAMIKCLEYAKSPRRRREGPRAPRVAVWEEIFADDGFFLESVLENVDFGACARVRAYVRACMWNCVCVWGGARPVLSSVRACLQGIDPHHPPPTTLPRPHIQAQRPRGGRTRR